MSNKKDYLKPSGLEEKTRNRNDHWAAGGYSVKEVRKWAGLQRCEQKKRRCLRCRKQFLSETFGNRLCEYCLKAH